MLGSAIGQLAGDGTSEAHATNANGGTADMTGPAVSGGCTGCIVGGLGVNVLGGAICLLAGLTGFLAPFVCAVAVTVLAAGVGQACSAMAWTNPSQPGVAPIPNDKLHIFGMHV